CGGVACRSEPSATAAHKNRVETSHSIFTSKSPKGSFCQQTCDYKLAIGRKAWMVHIESGPHCDPFEFTGIRVKQSRTPFPGADGNRFHNDTITANRVGIHRNLRQTHAWKCKHLLRAAVQWQPQETHTFLLVQL